MCSIISIGLSAINCAFNSYELHIRRLNRETRQHRHHSMTLILMSVAKIIVAVAVVVVAVVAAAVVVVVVVVDGCVVIGLI